MRPEEIVIKWEPKTLPPDVYLCHHCGGGGRNADGSAMISTNEIRIRPGSPCNLCHGSGHIRITPAERP